MSDGLLIGDAARVLGVSVDTVRRWNRAGTVRSWRDGANRRRFAADELLRVRDGLRRYKGHNRFVGVVHSVEGGGVLSLVRLDVGSHLLSALVPRMIVEELGLRPGSTATAVVSASEVGLV